MKKVQSKIQAQVGEAPVFCLPALYKKPVETSVDRVIGANAMSAAVKVFEERWKSGVSPGLSYGMFDAGGLIAAGGFGDSGHSTPDADTAFRIASCTKSFTAAAALVLRDRGLVDFDAPVTRYLGWLVGIQLPTPTSSVPTVRQLLSMSGGLTEDDPWADRQESRTSEELQTEVNRGLKFESVPGTVFAYSNLGYALLGQVIESVTGESYQEVVNEYLLRPLGLTSTGFSSSVRAGGGVATGFQKAGESWTPQPFSSPGAFSPIGGLFTSVRDLCCWAGWLAEAHRDCAGKHDDVLSPSSRREMQRVVQVIPATARSESSASLEGYGFGLSAEYFQGSGWISSHSGSYPGFSAHMRWHVATGVGVVLLENATYVKSRIPAAAALELLLDGVEAITATPWEETLEAERIATLLIDDWNAERASMLFAENVDMDESLPQRAEQINRAVQAIGGLTRPVRPIGGTSTTPTHRSWILNGHHGSLFCTLVVTPTYPYRVQSFQVRMADHCEAEAGLSHKAPGVI